MCEDPDGDLGQELDFSAMAKSRAYAGFAVLVVVMQGELELYLTDAD